MSDFPCRVERSLCDGLSTLSAKSLGVSKLGKSSLLFYRLFIIPKSHPSYKWNLTANKF